LAFGSSKKYKSDVVSPTSVLFSFLFSKGHGENISKGHPLNFQCHYHTIHSDETLEIGEFSNEETSHGSRWM
jgi:hypothetical protein